MYSHVKDRYLKSILNKIRMTCWVNPPGDELKIDGFLTNKLYGLYDLCLSVGLNIDSKVCEIGAFAGVSTELFRYFSDNVTVIDPFNLNGISKHLFLDKFYNDPCVTLYEDYSHNVNHLIQDEYFDLVYIDAEHTYEAVKNDFNLFLPKVKSDGYIGGHDWTTESPGVKKFVDELFEQYKYGAIYNDSSWLIKKSNIIK